MMAVDNISQSIQLVTIPFHGDQLVTFQSNGTPRIAMRHVVENIGLGWGSQRQKLLAQADKFACDDIVTHDASGRRQEMISIPVSKLPLWLATINPNKIPDPVKRAKVELYQAESAIALHDYWTKGIAVRGDLDGVVTNLDPSVMKALGGMFKGIVHKELAAAVHELLPAMVSETLASHRFALIEGVSALEVAEIAGYRRGHRPRGMSQLISRRLGRYHEDRGIPVRRCRHGSAKVKLFDETASRRWLADGGKVEIDNMIKERGGQGRFKLIKGDKESAA